ncbi:MAG: ECF transporter S component, partial [Chloroflexi bacterium]
MGRAHGQPRVTDGGRRSLRRWPAPHRAQRFPRLRHPDQQAARPRLAAARRSAGVTRWLTGRLADAVLIVVSGAGLGLFVAPLVLGARFPQAVALFSGLVAASALVVLGVALQTHQLSTRLLAILAGLVAVDATLRLVIVVGLLGFSPIFFLIIAGGFVMGPSFGFASGALTLLVSAVLTAGLGPWLPYQMLAAGWVGMGSGYLGRLSRRSKSRFGIALLCCYGGVAGIAYGLLLDLWEWPLLLAPASSPLSWAPGL